MMGSRRFATFLMGLICVAAAPALAQTPTIEVPEDSLACLYENKQKYLELPKNVLIFFPALCPAISREEVAAIVQNSSLEQSQTHTRAIMLKTEFSCLVDLIQEHLETSETSEEATAATVEFVLDCE